MDNLKRELNIKKAIFAGFIAIIIIALIVVFSMYIAEENFRKWIDTNLLRKSITEEEIASIDLNASQNNQIFCYSKYISLLKDKKIFLYNNYGEKVEEIFIDINTGLFDTNNKYLAVAEKDGQQFCLILDKTYLWDEKIEGQILQIHVNRNGYVAVVSTDTTFKAVINLYSPEGKALFKYYLSDTRVIDVSVSNDNKYVAFAEVDTSGTLIQSNVKILSIEKAQINSEEVIEYTYTADINKMITKIKYQNKGQLVCMYDDSINIINRNEQSEILNLENSITFMSVNMNNYIAYIKEETYGMFNSSSAVNIVNTSNNVTSTYTFDEVAKEIYTFGDVIGINIGTDIYFINSNGILLKKYVSKQEITNVMMSNNMAAIIYKDRIEIVNL